MQQAVMGHQAERAAAGRRALGPIALGAVVFAVVVEAIGVYADRSSTDQHLTREFVVVLAIIAIAAAAMFGWIVPKLLERDALGTPAMVLSALGLATVVVYWSGLPPILAGGGVLLGWADRGGSRSARLSRAALALGVLAFVADVAVLVLDIGTS